MRYFCLPGADAAATAKKRKRSLIVFQAADIAFHVAMPPIRSCFAFFLQLILPLFSMLLIFSPELSLAPYSRDYFHICRRLPPSCQNRLRWLTSVAGIAAAVFSPRALLFFFDNDIGSGCRFFAAITLFKLRRACFDTPVCRRATPRSAARPAPRYAFPPPIHFRFFTRISAHAS